MSSVDDLLRLLAAQRKEVELLSADIASKQEAFELSITGLKERRQLQLDRMHSTEAEIRRLALQMYNVDPEHKKEIHAKVKERDMKKVTYDSATAYEWCVEKGLFLTLNTKEFERFCTTSRPPDFVTITIEPQITIAREL